LNRFADRTKRLVRRQESDAFRRYIMPVSLLVGFAGLVGLLVVSFAALLNGRWEEGVFKAFAGMSAVPMLVFLLRCVRGHFYRVIREG